jgi:EpsI family protein
MDRTRAQILIVGALAALAVAGNTLRATEPEAATDLHLDALDTPVAGVYTEEPLDREFMDTLRARDVLYRIFTGPEGEPVWLFLGYFDRQKEGSQVHSPRHCYPGSGWNIEAEPSWEAPWGGRAVNSLVVNDGVERRLVVYWYQMQSRTEMDVLPLKLELTRRAILRQPQDVVFASISAPIAGDPASTMAQLAPLARDVHGEIDRLYRERHDRRPGD